MCTDRKEIQHMRWKWRRWQAMANACVTDADALQLALVWPGYARAQPGRRRGFWGRERTYEALSGWTVSRVMRAANVPGSSWTRLALSWDAAVRPHRPPTGESNLRGLFLVDNRKPRA